MSETGIFTYDLLHGVRLTVEEGDGVIDIHDLANLLATAMKHFKSQRSALPPGGIITSPFTMDVRDGSDAIIGKAEFSCPTPAGLPAALWTESVINAYCKADTLEQMLNDLPAAIKAAKRDGSYMFKAISLLERPTLHLHAFEEMIRHAPNR